MKNFKFLAALVLIGSAPIIAVEPDKKDQAPQAPAAAALPNAGIDVSLQFASNFVFRGDDVHKSRFAQQKKSYGSVNEAWTFQPSVTLKTPVDGLSFNVWGNFPMVGREDVDTDQRLSTTVTGNGLYAVPTANTDSLGSNILIDAIDPYQQGNTAITGPGVATYLRDKFTNPTTYYPANAAGTGINYSGVTGATLPMFRKEANGLKRQDEVDYTIGYSSSTKVGVIGFGIVSYQLQNARGKANPWTNAGGTYFVTEIFGSYALPQLPDLTIKSFADIVKSDQYHQLVYSKTIAINDNLGISLTTGPGYYIGSGTASGAVVQGWRDVTSSIGVTFRGFNIGLNAAYRPNLRMFDPDAANTDLKLVQLDGGSTLGDGMAPDPKYANSGILSDMINRGITERVRAIQSSASTASTNYTFTPRQHLPKWLYWVNLGYTASF